MKLVQVLSTPTVAFAIFFLATAIYSEATFHAAPEAKATPLKSSSTPSLSSSLTGTNLTGDSASGYLAAIPGITPTHTGTIVETAIASTITTDAPGYTTTIKSADANNCLRHSTVSSTACSSVAANQAQTDNLVYFGDSISYGVRSSFSELYTHPGASRNLQFNYLGGEMTSATSVSLITNSTIFASSVDTGENSVYTGAYGLIFGRRR